MQIESPTENVALLALMMAGVMAQRMAELGQLDEDTRRRLHHLVGAVRTHSHINGGDRFDKVFDQIDKKLDAVEA